MSEPEPPIRLTPGDLSSPTWHKLKAHLERRLRDLRGKNDGPMSEQETATIRGQIQCLKGLLALSDAEPPQDG